MKRLAKKFAKAFAFAHPDKRISWAAAVAVAPWDDGGIPTTGEREFRETFADELVRLGIARPRGVNSTQSAADRRAAGRVKRTLQLPRAASEALDRVAAENGRTIAETVSDLVLAVGRKTGPV